jgi:1,2-phenylacetyl-CoA epoxidase PaaB subunit
VNNSAETPKPKKLYKVDAETALRMWNEGKTFKEIAIHFPGVTIWVVRRAIVRAEKAGSTKTRHGIYHPPQPVPPMAALWQV